MKIQVHLWVLRRGDRIEHKVTDNELNRICIYGSNGDGYCHLFDGPAKQLQAWAAKREIPYQHLVLNVPVELEI